MAFRGVLLQLIEPENDACFHVVAPDTELTLPPPCESGHEALLTKWSRQKIVVADAVSRKLLQVTRLATVAPKEGERSVLWGVTTPFVSPEARTVGATPLNRYLDIPKTVNEMHVDKDASSLAAAEASSTLCKKSDASEGLTLRETELPVRICYCFQFRSDYEYDLFARTLAAFTRMQRYALLQSSVVMEMEISQEYKKRRAQESEHPEVAARNDQHLLENKTGKQEYETIKNKEKVLPTQKKVKAKRVIGMPPNKMRCVLCRILRKPDAPEYPKHPFVLKDGKGEFVHICKVCLERILQHRLTTSTLPKKSGEDNYCGLCAQSTEKLSATKKCAHKICTRVYCIPCVDKLIGKAQAHKVWRTENWLCPNCSTDNDVTPSCKEKNGTSSVPPEIVTLASTHKQKKRKRREEGSTADEDACGMSILASSTSKMKPIDYVVTYFKFLLTREKMEDFEESEDVCFCCKDGGEVVECDWKGMSGAFGRCPKVYHEDCLGYDVPEGKTWVCPRHRCEDCGIIAHYSCRFCVTSFCETHLPKDIVKLGQATRDIPTSTYVMCPRCYEQVQDAYKRKKIGSGLHSQLLQRQTGKR
ncbi:hypothetical protein PsorP6_011594 [Peronosclerospora sorghi]|uniref:Uncharacterized protein n=1 Tax=Peronosclerospora sorghi TaxID=230839 RepID=A0ACC0WIM5_9STRA|nr:hypothetical protein PsorP6_011594 [Peronosclerospora sorghi]